MQQIESFHRSIAMRSLASQNEEDVEENYKYQDPDSFLKKNKENENDVRNTL